LSDDEWELQRQLYRAECRYFDDQLSRLLSSLAERDVLEETIVILTADHGDMHGEHGRGGHPQEFWEEIVHVPLVIDIPGTDAKKITEQVSLVDVPPTLADALDLEVPTRWDGESRLPLVDGNGTGRTVAFVDVAEELKSEHAAVRRADGWKLLRHREDGEFLFDLSENPEEEPTTNRIDDSPTRYDELSEMLDMHVREMANRREDEQSGIQDEEMIEDHLKELGYME
jgi:arylsulfatase A-like enzyme